MFSTLEFTNCEVKYVSDVIKSPGIRSTSVGPSESASQRPSRPSTGTVSSNGREATNARSLARPPSMPFEVLWFKDDCDKDPNAKPSKSNATRPPMKKALRTADGEVLSRGSFKAVSKSGRLVANRLRQKAEEKFPDFTKNMTRSFFESAMTIEWRSALAEFEQEQPILQLCAGSWKAEQMLLNILRSMGGKNKRKKDGNRERRNNNSDSESDSESESGSDKPKNPKPSSAKRKREEEESQSGSKKMRTSMQEGISQNDDVDPSATSLLGNEPPIDTIADLRLPASQQDILAVKPMKGKGKQKQNREFSEI